MSEPIRTDVVIIGAGPVALFAVFQLGLYGFKCHLIDSMDRAGGQCAELYADKPIYDIPAYPQILGQELVERLLEQIAPLSPQFHFNQMVTRFERQADGLFQVTTDVGGLFEARIVVIAAGLGAFQRRTTAEVVATQSSPASPVSGYTIKAGLLADAGADCGFDLHDNMIVVSSETFLTAQPGVFAIGDICFYPGKLKLILSGFHEAALMTQAARRLLKPDQRAPVQYTTS
ncbi:NAD(P)/FAD-dependent oxidoreductase, partial [Paraburkholderia aspalathi]|nr:NAD(P)/FAD-dependent oxidoreductase [Paraburkholderia aspalathi]